MTGPPPVYNTTISSSITPGDLSGFDIIISWTVSMLIDAIVCCKRKVVTLQTCNLKQLLCNIL